MVEFSILRIARAIKKIRIELQETINILYEGHLWRVTNAITEKEASQISSALDHLSASVSKYTTMSRVPLYVQTIRGSGRVDSQALTQAMP